MECGPDFIDENCKDKTLNQLKNLTLVIPTYNRNYYLSRCLSYHTRIPYGNIIIADSSTQDKKETNKNIVDFYQNTSETKISYLEYAPENEKLGGDIYHKWADAVTHVNTKYSQILTDKEFRIPETDAACIDYLEKNPEINLCEGRYYYIESPKPGTYTIRNMYPSKIPLTQDNAISRLNTAATGINISSNQMGIRRSDFHKSLYQHLQDSKIDDLRFGEFTLELLTIIRSKTMYLDLPYSYRDICNYASKSSFKRNESSSLRYPNLTEYQQTGIYGEYLQRFINCLAPEIVKYSNMDLTTAEEYVRTKLIDIVRMRGFFGNEKLSQNPLWYLWRHSPYWMKKIGGRVIPKNMLDFKGVSTPDEKKIVKLISDTVTEYNADKPVFH